MPQVTYSFANVDCAIVGPNGTFSMGFGAGIDEGGITAELTEVRGAQRAGADGQAMTTLYTGKLGKITIRVQKTSPLNAFLSALYNADASDATQYGQNTIACRDSSLLDVIAGAQCGIEKHASQTYGKEGPMNEWVFLVGTLNFVLGGGGR